MNDLTEDIRKDAIENFTVGITCRNYEKRFSNYLSLLHRLVMELETCAHNSIWTDSA